VIGDDEWNAVILVNRTTELSYRRFCVQKSLRGEGSKCNNYFWLDQLQLPDEIRAARCNFIRQWISISRRPMLEDIADEHVLSGQIDGGKDLREELSCLTDERSSRRIFIRTRGLPHTHELCLGIPFAGNGIRGSLVQSAASAFCHCILDCLQ